MGNTDKLYNFNKLYKEINNNKALATFCTVVQQANATDRAEYCNRIVDSMAELLAVEVFQGARA